MSDSFHTLGIKKGLNKAHLELLKDLVDEALAKAAKAMEKMLKIRIRSNLLNYGNGHLDPIPELDLLGRFKVHLVKVKFKGEINGAFYFIINGHEVDLINRVCLPESMNTSRSTENKLIKHGFMSEIENVIASLALTEISEFIGVQLIGEVPEVHIMTGESCNAFLMDENFKVSTAFYVKSLLSGVAVNISPYFIWMLDQSFVDKLKENIVE